MYVKLAFSVAAHLDSEIMIMDEVLAVGDMKFQKKCLTKMRQAAKQDGRTVLYLSLIHISTGGGCFALRQGGKDLCRYGLTGGTAWKIRN